MNGHDYNDGWKLWGWKTAALVMICWVGCAPYEEGYTGHYQEIELDELQDRAVAVDFFRFGGDVRAVLRYYDIGSSAAREAPFDSSNEVHCRWSRVAEFDDVERNFSLTVPANARDDRIDLEGMIGDDGRMQLVIDEAIEDEPQQIVLERNHQSPNSDCSTIDDFFVRAIFGESDSNGFDPETYQLRHPVFSLLWAGLEPVSHDGALVYVAINRPEPSIRLTEGIQFNRHNNELTGNLSVSVPPPAEQILVESGDTRYALAHFVVIDDSDGEGSFSWDVNEEPVVATALEQATPDHAPEGVEITGWGKGLLFVEGRLDELHENLQAHFDGGIEDAERGRHFYIVELFYHDDEVRRLRLPPRPQADRPVQRRVPLQVTEEHLDAGEVPVPRLFPHN